MKRTKKQKPLPDPQTPKRKTLAEAKQRILETFVANGWNHGEQRRYAEIAGIGFKSLGEYDQDEVRAVYRRMVEGRMILEQENE